MTRRYDIDALRVIAFVLLILYHCCMLYVVDWGFHIKSAYQFEWLQTPMLLVNQWRMPLLFLISGLAINFVWQRYSARELAWRRIKRLGLPFLFGTAIVVTPQPYFEAMSKGLVEPGYFAFLGDYLTWQRFPDGAWSDTRYATWTWNHLWYLPYLLFYTLVLLPIAVLLDGPASVIKRGFQRLRGPWLILIPILPLMPIGLFIYPHFPNTTHAFYNDWYAHAHYFTFFLYGYLLGRAEGTWRELARLRRFSLVLAGCMFVVLVNRDALLAVVDSTLEDYATAFIVYLNRWAWLLAALGWGHQLLNKPFKWLPYATEAVFSWYILHQSITITAGAQLAKLSLGPFVEPLLVLAATVGGCLALHHFVIRKVPWLQPLFGIVIRQDGPQRVRQKALTEPSLK